MEIDSSAIPLQQMKGESDVSSSNESLDMQNETVGIPYNIQPPLGVLHNAVSPTTVPIKYEEPLCHSDGETDTEAYMAKLRNIGPKDRTSLRDELHRLAKTNEVKHLKVFCRYLKNNDISLSADDMLGDTYKESALHVAIVKQCHSQANILIDDGGTVLVKKPYTSPEYLGVTALHLAVIKGGVDVTSALLDAVNQEERMEMLNAQVLGKEFKAKYHCECIPLHLAVVEGDIIMIECLLKYGAQVLVRDNTTGNTIIHTLAKASLSNPETGIQTLKALLENDQLENWWDRSCSGALGVHSPDVVYAKNLKEALLKTENWDGLTPFIYATTIGATQFAEVILGVEYLYKFPQWDLGPTSYTLYEMSEIDTCITTASYWTPVDKTNNDNFVTKPNALEIFAFGLGDSQLEFGQVPPIKSAMVNKWNSYKYWFLGWCLLHIFVMSLFMVSLEYRPIVNTVANISGNVTSIPMDTVSGKEVGVFLAEIIVLLAGIMYFVLEIVDSVLLLQRKYWKWASCEGTPQPRIPIHLSLQTDVYRTLLFIFSVSILAIFVLRMVDSEWQDMTYAIAALTGWGFMLFFTRAFQNIGIFTVMLRRMIRYEMAYFSVVFLLFLLSFGSATYSLFQQQPSTERPEQVTSIPITLFSLFRLLVGLDEFVISTDARIPWLMKIFFVAFILFSNVLLLNMLIAAMSNTYNQWESLKESMWLKMRTKSILLIERRLPKCFRPHSKLRQFGERHQWFLGAEQSRQ